VVRKRRDGPKRMGRRCERKTSAFFSFSPPLFLSSVLWWGGETGQVIDHRVKNRNHEAFLRHSAMRICDNQRGSRNGTRNALSKDRSTPPQSPNAGTEPRPSRGGILPACQPASQQNKEYTKYNVLGRAETCLNHSVPIQPSALVSQIKMMIEGRFHSVQTGRWTSLR